MSNRPCCWCIGSVCVLVTSTPASPTKIARLKHCDSDDESKGADTNAQRLLTVEWGAFVRTVRHFWFSSLHGRSKGFLAELVMKCLHRGLLRGWRMGNGIVDLAMRGVGGCDFSDGLDTKVKSGGLLNSDNDAVK